MSARTVFMIVTILAAGAYTSITAGAKAAASPKPMKTGHLSINGIDYYYEVHGKGEPMLLLHGGLGTIDMFAPVLPTFAAQRTVIAVDLQGHGRSSLGNRPIRLEDMADDMAAIITQLGYNRVDAVGYSMGGGVVMHLAARHPGQVRRLAIVSAGYSQDGFYPEMLPQQAQISGAMADMMKETPMYKAYVAVAPRPQDFAKLLDRIGEAERTSFDFSEVVRKIQSPTLLVFGDSDMIRLEHVVAFYKMLGGGQQDAGWNREHIATSHLAILPNVTHYEIFMSPALPAVVLPFINGVSNAPSWSKLVSSKK